MENTNMVEVEYQLTIPRDGNLNSVVRAIAELPRIRDVNSYAVAPSSV